MFDRVVVWISSAEACHGGFSDEHHSCLCRFLPSCLSTSALYRIGIWWVACVPSFPCVCLQSISQFVSPVLSFITKLPCLLRASVSQLFTEVHPLYHAVHLYPCIRELRLTPPTEQFVSLCSPLDSKALFNFPGRRQLLLRKVLGQG